MLENRSEIHPSKFYEVHVNMITKPDRLKKRMLQTNILHKHKCKNILLKTEYHI